ncbi:DUF2795 domain-containing protein [Streptomyces sp. NPDC126497]|uniref:DUF2795 domain-containing protein n=1 Tax=Streptomyces sp. NPDC126497 TaxID=3155313 RepID=UPI00331C2472
MHPGGPVPPPGEERDRAQAEADSLCLGLARHLDRTVFPAGRRSVLDVLEAHHAPDPVPEAARGLSEEGTYADVTENVEALGHRPTR